MTDTHTSALLGGRYRLQAPIASGGMAAVHRATDQVLGRPVAVKVMHPGLASDPGFVERFRREARSAASLNHPNVVTVHDWGREGDAIYMVMELVEGANLRDRLRSGPLTLEETTSIVSAVAAALDHAHAAGIVHRDVKPENVLIGPDGSVKVTDFGVARALAQGRLTSGAVVGTMQYVAPEQLQDADVDGRADVYALGVLAYELLTGRPAFDGDSPAAVAAARLTRSVPSPGVSPAVDGAIARATALRPEDRFEHASGLARALEAAPPVSTPPQSTPGLPTTVLPIAEAPGKRRRRRRWPAVLSGTLLVGAIAAAAALSQRQDVPSVVDRPLADARSRLQQAGLRAGSVLEVFDPRPAGTVLRSEPGPGRTTWRGADVRLVVSKGPEMLAVPVVEGMPADEARAAITAAGFAVGDQSEAFHNEIGDGLVAQQTPSGGTAERGSAIAIVVSKGPDLVGVPEVAGMPYEQARAAVSGAGFDAARSDDFSDTVAEGTTVRTSPSGRAVRGSKVTIVVSKGPKPFPMPNLVGMDRAAARSKATSSGLVVGNEYAVPGSGKPAGQVQGQNPPAGSDVRRGSRVDIYYAA